MLICWFSPDVTAAILLYSLQANFDYSFCLGHQHGSYVYCILCLMGLCKNQEFPIIRQSTCYIFFLLQQKRQGQSAIDMQAVGKCIENLMGDAFHSHYLQDTGYFSRAHLQRPVSARLDFKIKKRHQSTPEILSKCFVVFFVVFRV